MIDAGLTERIRNYITSFELEEGGNLSVVESPLARGQLYWGTWYGRKLVLVQVTEARQAGDYDLVELGFSLDFAPYEVAEFCRQFEACVGPWVVLPTFFMVTGDVADDTEKVLQGDRATRYRAFRDCGLLEGGKQ